MPPKRQTRQPSQRRAHDTFEVIVRATAQILSREGATRLTTNRVAATAGVSIGSLYQYFPDKQALIAAVRARFEASFRERFVAAVERASRKSLPEAIAELVRMLVAIHVEDPLLHNAVSEAVPEADRPMIEQMIAAYLMARRDEVRPADLRLAAAVTLELSEALIHGVAVRTPARLADEAFVAEVTDVLVRYLVR
jgi:AcrR family transcriptional regulator